MSLAELFYCREAIRTGVKRWQRRKRLPSRQQFTLEALEPRVLLSATPTEVFANQALEPAAVTVPAGLLPSLDVDLNGQADALSDGIVIIRHLFGFTGNALTDGAVDPAGQRTDPTAIANYLNSIQNTALDVDLNGGADALSDGIVIIRSLFGFTGNALTEGAVDSGGQRTDPAVIATFLDNMNPQRELIAPLVTAGLQQDTGSSATDSITNNATITGTIADLNPIAGFTARLESAPTVPTIRVTNLIDGAIVSSGVIEVEFSAANFLLGDQGETHLNFYVDADPTPYRFFNGATDAVLYQGVHTHFIHWHSAASIELHGPAAGDHQIRFVLVDAAGQELANLDATTVLDFSVATAPQGEFVLDPYVTNVNFPTSMAVAPDGRLFYTELLTGAIRVIDPAGQLQPAPWYELTVKTGGEEGLLGLAIDPNFATNGFVYAYHTADGPERNRVVRLQEIQGVGTNETVILDNLPTSATHNGGKLTFGPDGTLYVVIGDTAQPDRAQELTFLGGKILRINKDGSIPADNPFLNSPVYSYGHRNSFGLVFHPRTGDLWETENGKNDNDEVNRIVAGGNYGWPIVAGVANDPRFIDPLVTYTPTIAPTGIAVASDNSAYPVQYHNNLFFADFNNGAVTRVLLAGTDLTDVATVSLAFPGGLGGLLDIVEGPDGFLYVSSSGQISRLRLADLNVGQITDVVAAPQADGTTLVTWDTQFPSDGQVEYGLTSAYGLLTQPVAPLTTAHAVTVGNVQSNRTYHYRVRSRDGGGALAVSGDFTFTTGLVPNVAGTVAVLADLQPDGRFTFDRTRLEQIFGGPLLDGGYVLHLQATDIRGNVSGLRDVTFTLDITAPAVPTFDLDPAFDTLPVGDQQTSFAVVTLTGHTDGTVSVVLSDSSLTARSDSTGTFTLAGIPLAEGPNLLTVRVMDVAGNQSEASQTITLVLGAPAVGSAVITTTGSRVEILSPSETITLDEGGRSNSAGLPGDLLTRLDDFRQRGRFRDITGAGMTAVIIDTGIDVDHPFFGPDADHNGVADRIVFQWDFADNDADASDRIGHGSHIASLIGSQDLTYPGVASDADLIALKVFSNTGTGTFAFVEQALQWVVAHAAEYSIDVVNLSLGDGQNWTTPDSHYGIGDEFAALANDGIIVVAAAGNNFFTAQSRPGVSYPAADPNVIGVGAVWTQDFGGPWRWSSGAIDLTTGPDRIASFSQRDATMTEIFAPGARLVGANHLGDTVSMQGTSQAAAYLSGTAILAQQVAEHDLGRKLTPQEFTDLVVRTGKKIVDGDDEQDNVVNTGLTFPRVDMLQLAKGIHRFAAWERGEEGHHHSDQGLALAFAQRCWVKDFVAGTSAESVHDEEELLIALPG